MHFIQVEANNENKIGVQPLHLIQPATGKPTWKLADFWISILTTFQWNEKIGFDSFNLVQKIVNKTSNNNGWPKSCFFIYKYPQNETIYVLTVCIMVMRVFLNS